MMLAPVMTLLVFLSEISNETMPKYLYICLLMYGLIVFSFVRFIDEVSLETQKGFISSMQCNTM